MKIKMLAVLAASCMLACGCTSLSGMGPSGTTGSAFRLSSADFRPGEALATKFTANVMGCKGGNISPALNWENPPAGTKSFALMVHDPDANTGGAGIWHWVVINIPATVSHIEQGAGTSSGATLPSGSKQIANDYAGLTGSAGWGGPCPPKGQGAHRYNFTWYALKVDKLSLPPAATASQAGFIINLNALGAARLTAIHGGND